MILFVFTLLIAGHVLADFVLQSDALVAGKQNPQTRSGALRRHFGQVAIAHALWLALIHPALAVIVGPMLAGLHLVIDRWKLRKEQAYPATLRWFLWDQGLHLGSLLFVAVWIAEFPSDMAIDHWRFAAEWADEAIFLTVLALNARLGGFLVAEFLRRYKPRPASSAEVTAAAENSTPADGREEGELLRTGRVIGMLERVLLFLILVQGEWAAVGFVIAAKSVVRFPELSKRAFAEYYLLGTLASFLFAIISVLVYHEWLRWLPLG